MTGNSNSDVDITAEHANNPNIIVISGTIPISRGSHVKYMAVKNPAEFGAFVFKETFLSKGIAINGKLFCTRGSCTQMKDLSALPADDHQSSLSTLAVYRSPKLSEIMKVINKISNNLYTEQLFLTIAKTRQKEGNSQEAAQAVREILTKVGINLEGFYMVDGSGLSRLNLITPEQTVQLLRMMAKSPYFNVFYDSLAIPGTEGTLKNWPRHADSREHSRKDRNYAAREKSLRICGNKGRRIACLLIPLQQLQQRENSYRWPI